MTLCIVLVTDHWESVVWSCLAFTIYVCGVDTLKGFGNEGIFINILRKKKERSMLEYSKFEVFNKVGYISGITGL